MQRAEARGRRSAMWVAAVLCGMLAVPATQAATFSVNSSADAVDSTPGDGVCATDAGECTLRAAIMESNALAGADVVVLRARRYLLTIEGTDEDGAATGDLDIEGDLTLRGKGTRLTVIDARGLDRVFDVGPATTVTTRFFDLTIMGGRETSGQGAGIRSNDSTLTLTRCTVRNNSTVGPSGYGGGIWSGLGPLTILSSSVLHNGAIATDLGGRAGGGGIYQKGPLTVISSTVADNLAASTQGIAEGGGVDWGSHNSGTIRNSRITHNQAISLSGEISRGGGMYLNIAVEASASVVGSNISDNTARSTANEGYGGGISIGGEGTVTLSATTVKNNESSKWGGGIFIRATPTPSSLAIKNLSLVSGNVAGIDGGGIYREGTTTVITISGSSKVVENHPNDKNF